MQHETNNLLLDLPPAALDTTRGERRSRLMNYLSRWGHDAVLLAYLDHWLTTQPESVMLREKRAGALIATGEADAAMPILDALDAERIPSQSRRQARWDAFRALGDSDALLALAPRPEEASPAVVYDWLRYGDALRDTGALDDAADAYAQVAAIEPEAVPPRRLAALALAASDPAAARGHLETWFVRNPDHRPTVDELRLLRDACTALNDTAAVASLAAQLAAREREEREPLAATFGAVPGADGEAPGTEYKAPGATAETTAAPQGTRGTRAADDPVVLANDPVPALVSAPALPPEAYTALHEVFGLADFRPNQVATIARALAGQSMLAIMPTGAGKSLTYQLPALLLPKATVVISPLIALMKDQVDNLPPALQAQATAINSTLTANEVRERLKGIAAGAYKLVYVAPERLRNRPFLHALRRAGVSLFVVDEAHCVSLWGLSFRPDYLFIREALDALGRPPVLALTATAGEETQAEIVAQLGIGERIMASVFRPNLRFEVRHAGNRAEKGDLTVRLCAEIAGPIIVYARARGACEEIADLLRRHGIQAAHYHAQVPDRATVQERFMRGETRVLVATVAFGMGVDKADVRAIIHVNLPQSVEAYYQEAGRAGRDGQPARCVLLYSASDKSQMTRWLHEGAITKEHLRHLYRILRGTVSGQYGIVSLDDVQRAAIRINEDETFARVGVSMLARVGLARRHFDVPRLVTLTLRDGGDGSDTRFEQLLTATGLYLGEVGEYDLLPLATQLGRAPDDLEADLLAWHDLGWLRYVGVQRDSLIELLPAPADVGARIDTLLEDYAARQDARVEAMAAYARGATCRHAALAAHFGQRLGRCGTACDNCLRKSAVVGGRQSVVSNHEPGPATCRAPLPVAARNDDGRPDALRVLAGVAALPYAMGRSGLARLLRGAPDAPVGGDRSNEFGALRHLSGRVAEEMIEQLIAEGYLDRDAADEYRRVTLAQKGQRALADPTLLPEWAMENDAPDEPDPDLLARLKEWRLEQAREAGLPAYCIVSNATMETLAAVRPQSEAALLRVKGIGPKTVETYGVDLLALLA